MKKIDNRRDLLLLLLYSPGSTGQFNEGILGRTRFVKMVFLFKEELWKKFKSNIEIKDENLYEFFPWNYGPFSMEIYDDITFFILRDFIDVSYPNQESLIESVEEWNFWNKTSGAREEDDVQEYQEEEFKLTEKGISFTKDLYSELNDVQCKLLFEFKSRIAKIPLRALLRYVYKNYPNQIINSTIKDDIIG
jgi:hypothetical protein